MKYLSNNRWILLIPVTLFFITGCQQSAPSARLDIGPDANSISAMPDYVADAMEITGGTKSWMVTRKFTVDAVVTFYLPDASFYLTEQHYKIYPWSGSTLIQSVEPQASFSYLLSGSDYALSQGVVNTNNLVTDVAPRYLAELILNSTTAPARLASSPANITRINKPVKLEGRWYYTIRCIADDGVGPGPYCRKITFYQHKDTSLIDMIWAACSDGSFFVARAYDYHEVEQQSIRIPDKIEIFSSDAAGLIGKRLVKIDFNPRQPFFSQ